MKPKEIVFPQQIVTEQNSLSETYGKFIIEPFERGYGHTLGNSLRRILLSSIEGAAATSVKIKGADHEYGTLPGVKEDVLEVMMNLKKIRFKVFSDGPENVKLMINKPGEIKAKDIELNNSVEIVNPEQHIATLSPAHKLEVEIEVARGRGYLPVEKQNRADLPVGTILVDAIFTPVRKVNYEVEDTRIGQITDYDKLIIEIWTDGTVKPGDALAYAAKILKDSISIFIPAELDKQVEKTEEKEPSQEQDKLQKLLDEPVEIMELSVRANKCLKKAKLHTIRDLVRKKEEELLVYRNFGKKSLEEIIDKLKEMGLSLSMEV
ncbi:MAG: DNA-directed RNA polymerase subunit alpha [Elusimicrobiota bacterium]